MSSSRAAENMRWLLVHSAGLIVVLWVLAPVFLHAQVRVASPGVEVVRALRSAPTADRLAELARQRPLGPKVPEGALAIDLAERWLAASRSGGRHPILFAMDAEDLGRDMGIGPLPFASLYAADVFVAAFVAGGEARHLETARDLILGFARFERAAWREPGLLWNDHAIAARAGVVLRFWAAYRSHPSFDESAAAEILQHVARSAALLAKPSHFTAFSNHGVMQNIALLQVAVAFPGLVDATSLARTAFERLGLQWGYYISPEGVVLEHSALYHAEGVSLLQLAVALLRLNGVAVPPAWNDQLRKADAFLALLTRPDGSLPAYGDTYLMRPAASPGSPGGAPNTQLDLFPISGYALLQSREAGDSWVSHTVVTWSHFDGHAHKHADEPGLLIWSAGRAWVTHSGYAPYGSEQRVPIEGWLGSNAPHGLGEAPDPSRTSRLLGRASAPAWTLLDLERLNPGGIGFRRQVLQVKSCHWLVIDHSLGPAPWPSTETLWTFHPDLTLAPQEGESYLLRAPEGASMRVSFSAGARLATSMHHGSREPFAGFVATDQGMSASPALRVLAAPRGWTATVFSTSPCEDSVTLRVDEVNRWEASGADWQLRRDGAALSFTRTDNTSSVTLAPAPDITAQRAAVQQALASALKAYPKYRNVDHYRLRMARWLGGLWFGGLLLSLALRRPLAARAAAQVAWQATIVVAWVAIALWLQLSYFAS